MATNDWMQRAVFIFLRLQQRENEQTASVRRHTSNGKGRMQRAEACIFPHVVRSRTHLWGRPGDDRRKWNGAAITYGTVTQIEDGDCKSPVAVVSNPHLGGAVLAARGANTAASVDWGGGDQVGIDV